MKRNHIVFGLLLSLLGCSDDKNVGQDTGVVTDTANDTAVSTDTGATSDTAVVEDTATVTDTTASETVDDVVADTTPVWTPNVYTYPTCGTTATELAGCVDPAKLLATLTTIVGSRVPGEPKWQEAQDLCKSTFESLGYTTTLQPTLRGMNVIGVKTGSELPTEQVIIGAHYDGVRDCDAADDNGTGIAGTLETARVLAAGTHKRTLVVSCWDVEELGLVGSQTHAASVTPADVKAVYVYEMIGYTDETPGSQQFPPGFDLLFPAAKAALDAVGNRGVFITLIAGENMKGPAAALASAAATIGLPTVPVEMTDMFIGLSALGDLRRSDHAPFWAQGIPAMQITDTANFRNPNYHCLNGTHDTIASLDQPFMRAVVAATIVAAKTTLDATDPGTSLLAHPPACDVHDNDCGSGKRCAYLDDAGTFKRMCIDLTASPAALGDLCTRPDGITGRDTCDVGLFCGFYGARQTQTTPSPAYERICSTLCTSFDDCSADESCLGLGNAFYDATGTCRPKCGDVFGTSCGDDQRCGTVSVIGSSIATTTCTPSGGGPVGGSCTTITDCAPGGTCGTDPKVGASTCLSYCDTDHACPGGKHCRTITLVDPAATLGVCVLD